MKVINAKKIRWIKNGLVGFYQGNAGFAIQDENGLVLAKDGEPCVWRTKTVAKEVAPYAKEFKNREWIAILSASE